MHTKRTIPREARALCHFEGQTATATDRHGHQSIGNGLGKTGPAMHTSHNKTVQAFNSGKRLSARVELVQLTFSTSKTPDLRQCLAWLH